MFELETNLWEFLVENNIATNEEIKLVTQIAGYEENTLLHILYARTGFRSIEQSMGEGFYISPYLLDHYGLDEDDNQEEDEQALFRAPGATDRPLTGDRSTPRHNNQ